MARYKAKKIRGRNTSYPDIKQIKRWKCRLDEEQNTDHHQNIQVMDLRYKPEKRIKYCVAKHNISC